MKKPTFSQVSASLLSISVLALGFSGCQVESDPVAKYENVKKYSVAPHNNHNIKTIVKEIEFNPQNVVVSEFFSVEKDASTSFIAGQEGTLGIKIHSRLLEKLKFNIEVTGLTGSTKVEKTTGKENHWTVHWTPAADFVPQNERAVEHQFKVKVKPIAAESDKKAIEAIGNDDLTSTMWTTVYKDVRRPEIVSIDWEGKEKAGDSTIQMNEGEIKEFTVRVKSAGASTASTPNLSPDNWSSSMDDGQMRIFSGSSYIETVSVESVGHNEWTYKLRFNTKDKQIITPRQVESNKPVDTDSANYRVRFSSFHTLDFSGDTKDQGDRFSKIDGPATISQDIDFKVKYTGKSTKLFFPWDDGINSLRTCQGETYSYNFQVSSNTGIGHITVDTEAALASFKRNSGVSGHVTLTCNDQKDDSSRATCIFRWKVATSVKDGKYPLTLTATLKTKSQDQESVVVEKTSTESILVESKNEVCNTQETTSAVQTPAASTQNKKAESTKTDITGAE